MSNKVQKLLECYRKLKEDAAAAGGGMTVGGGNIAGLPPDQPPVDLKRKKDTIIFADFRKRQYKPLNMFYQDSVKQLRKGAKNAGKGSGKR